MNTDTHLGTPLCFKAHPYTHNQLTTGLIRVRTGYSSCCRILPAQIVWYCRGTPQESQGKEAAKRARDIKPNSSCDTFEVEVKKALDTAEAVSHEDSQGT